MAQVDHLALYVGAAGYPKSDSPDPRHFSYIAGKCKTVEALGGCWAPSPTYGTNIVTMMKKLEATAATEQPTDNTPDGYAKDAVSWAVSNGILCGDSSGDLLLRTPISRQDAVVMMKRVYDLFNK